MHGQSPSRTVELGARKEVLEPQVIPRIQLEMGWRKTVSIPQLGHPDGVDENSATEKAYRPELTHQSSRITSSRAHTAASASHSVSSVGRSAGTSPVRLLTKRSASPGLRIRHNSSAHSSKVVLAVSSGRTIWNRRCDRTRRRS